MGIGDGLAQHFKRQTINEVDTIQWRIMDSKVAMYMQRWP